MTVQSLDDHQAFRRVKTSQQEPQGREVRISSMTRLVHEVDTMLLLAKLFALPF